MTDQEKLEFIVAKSSVAIALWKGPHFTCETVNNAWKELFGPEKSLGRTFNDVCSELLGRSSLKQLKKVYKTGVKFNINEVPVQVMTGSEKPEYRYYDFSYIRLDNQQGQPYGVFSQALNVLVESFLKMTIRIKTSKH